MTNTLQTGAIPANEAIDHACRVLQVEIDETDQDDADERTDLQATIATLEQLKSRPRSVGPIPPLASDVWSRRVSDRELATILAALRFWQKTPSDETGDEADISTNGGAFPELTNLEIDHLCRRLNAGL